MDSSRPHLRQNDVPSSTDLKLDMLANQLKVNIKDTEVSSSSSSVVEIIDDGDASVASNSVPDEEPPSPRMTRPATQYTTPVPSPAKSRKNERYRKVELLRIFQELETKGVRLSSAYTMDSDLDEMEQEFEILKSVENKKQAVRLYRGFMLNGIQALEFLNEAYNPFEFHLKGWSEHVGTSLDDYNEVFGELYEKYKNTGRKIEPELKLVLMLAMSATTFHATQTLLGVSSFPRQRPEPAMKGPDSRDFLNRLRKERAATAPPVPPVPPAPARPHPTLLSSSSDDISSTTITTTTRRNKRPPMVINV